MDIINSILGVSFSILLVYLILVLGLNFLKIERNKRKRQEINVQIRGLANNTLEMTPQEFMEMRKATCGGRKSYALTQNFAGVYILHNRTKNMYYVGQGQKVFDRVNSHFSGRGNGDVYADYKYGDVFTIKMIELEKSGFKTLNELERYTITTYNSFAKGYNKTRGNK